MIQAASGLPFLNPKSSLIHLERSSLLSCTTHGIDKPIGHNVRQIAESILAFDEYVQV